MTMELRKLAVLGLIVAFCCAGSPLKAATIDGVEYTALTDVAESYEMVAAPARENPLERAFSGEKHSLIVKIDSRQAILDGIRHWLSFPTKLDETGALQISQSDLEATIEPAFDPHKAGKLSKVETVVFDPGHGGYDKGGQGELGLEKTYTLDVVNRARKILEAKGITVVQSRLNDSFPTLNDRSRMIKNYDNPIFVSIHFNAAGWRPAAEGLEIFSIPPLGSPSTGKEPSKSDNDKKAGDRFEEASFVLSNTIYQTLIAKSPAYDRGVKRSRFQVLRYSDSPAVLIEGGFLTNPEEAKRIHSEDWRQTYSAAVADGIMAYIAFANEGTLPPRAIDLEHEPTDDFVDEG